MRRTWARGAALGSALLAIPLWASADDKTTEKQMCIAAAEQGQSERDDGQYRAARDSFLKCANEGCPRVIVQSCTKWLRELNESAPTIVLGAKDEHGSDLTDVKVTFDGAPFATTLTGKPMEADAGAHLVRFERDGSIPVELKLLLRAGERARVVSVTLLPVAPFVDAGVEDAEAAHEPAQAEAVLSTHHVTAGAIGLGAVVAAVTGIVFILQSNHKRDTASSLRANLPSDACSGAASATCTALSSDVHAQHDDMNVATVLFAGAGALAAGAIATWVFWPRDAAALPEATGMVVPIRGGAVLQVAGSFR